MKQKETYDRLKVGNRLRNQRKQLGWSRKYVAERIGLAEKYYADIERGTCGMSVETLLAVTRLYELTMDELIYGAAEEKKGKKTREALLKNLESLPEEKQECCLQMLFLFMRGIEGAGLQEQPKGQLREEGVG